MNVPLHLILWVFCAVRSSCWPVPPNWLQMAIHFFKSFQTLLSGSSVMKRKIDTFKTDQAASPKATDSRLFFPVRANSTLWLHSHICGFASVVQLEPKILRCCSCVAHIETTATVVSRPLTLWKAWKGKRLRVCACVCVK